MEAKNLLERVIASGELSHDTLVLAQRYLLFAAASQGDGNANRMIEALAPMTAEDLLAILALLETAAEFSTPSKQRYIGELEDRLLDDFAQRGEMTPSSQRAFEIVRAAIDLNVGTPDRVDDSIRRLRKLRQDQPHDARSTMELGRAYLQARRYESAVETFRQLIADQRTGSPNWYRGKLYLTRGLRLSGQTEQAKRILDQLEILRPDLGGPKLRQAFLQEKRLLDARSN
ncbi:MAG: tetratricopeptide repeat protein [Planctomycetota bacterium]